MKIFTDSFIYQMSSFTFRKMLMCSLVLFLFSCEIRKIDPETGSAIIEERQPSFNAHAFVDEIWQTQILPTIQEDAIELTKILDMMNNGDMKLSEQIEFREGIMSRVFLVIGSGIVVEADTSSRVGFLTVEIPSNEDDLFVKILIGPVISGTALRDALSFIQFDQFTNQIEYASVSRALHHKIVNSELNSIDFSNIEMKKIRFNGALLFIEGQAVITPVQIEITD